MNEYELRREEKIRKNQALLATLDIKPVIPKQRRDTNGKPPAKTRKVLQEKADPSRTSARIAAALVRPSYNDDVEVKTAALPRSAPKKSALKKSKHHPTPNIEDETEPLIPSKNVDEIRAGWTAWGPSAAPPTRDDNQVFHFGGYPDFTPNKSPEEMIRQGSFGGSYWRPLKSHKLGIIIENDWAELPNEWVEGLNPETYLTNPFYNPDVNKFKVSCGQSIEEWEAAGWISHEHDVRGWFQWYCRFFQGRRCEDDERQVSRWKKCVGETGRWRRMLLKKYMHLGVREVFDDGADEDAPEVSPVMHQTCHHWAFEVRQEHLDELWRTRGA
jgi:hypothetical protein